MPSTAIPLPGDPGYPMFVERALRHDQVSEEQAGKLFHKHAHKAHDRRKAAEAEAPATPRHPSLVNADYAVEHDPVRLAIEAAHEDDAQPMSSHSWMPVNITLTGAEPPSPPTIGGIAYPDRVQVWSGEPEALKSMVALTLAVDEIRAGRVVLYIDLENGDREILVRLHELGLTDEEIDRGFFYVSPTEPMTSDAEIVADVAQLIETRQPSLIVIDSYTASLTLHGCDPNSAVDVEWHNREVVRPLRASAAGLILIDHVTKNREARGRYSIASERKIGVADVHVGFEIVVPFGRGRRGMVKLIVHKDRPGHLHRPKAAEIEFTSDIVTNTIGWTMTMFDPDTADEFRPTHLMEKVSRYIEPQPSPITRKQIEDALPHKATYVRTAMDCLVADGFARESSGARGARLMESIRPFREVDLVPTSSRDDTPDVVPTSSPTESHNDAG